MSSESYAYLSSMPHFSILPEEELRRVSEVAVLKKYPKGTIFAKQDETEIDSIYVVKSGVIELFDAQSQLIGVNLTQSRELSIVLSVNSELAKIFDSQCPELDDGITLGQVVKQETGTTI